MTLSQTELDFSRPVEPICAPLEDHKRLKGQNLEILKRLRSGPATNVELAALSLKYTARISDIRAAGYDIEATRVDGGLWQYKLTIDRK
jgi:hypothetical protein